VKCTLFASAGVLCYNIQYGGADMKNSHGEARRWLVQAESDFRFATLGLERGFYAQCCFLCQQAAEKAIKALF
jgi:hypothetical protein